MTGFLRPPVNDDELLPLIRTKSESERPHSHSIAAKWKRHFTVQVKRERADVLLILCFLITGLLDSSCISVWGSFVSMQTGNSVYIGLGLAAPTQSTRWLKSTVSVLSFCVGSFIFSRFHAYFSPKRRWVLCVSFIVQTAITVLAATIVTLSREPPHPVPDPVGDHEKLAWHILWPIALLAFQSAGQAVTSRVLKYNGLTTVALTGVYCDVFSDVEVFTGLKENTERNRRLGAPVCLLVGAFLGGRFAHSSLGVGGALWLASALKLGVVVAWVFWPEEGCSLEEE
ncbi:hypothetical protein QBC37DRAFT_291098 [Rhypophila decipiens]|uniref:DUF1275 domain protein n=1 Tax=Rhypophila decipiens TaxID=261697 RepID=A0AAN6Y6J6_9PEZI|nr:hypothetical protein QBC37DRAFT_291098 [Rhypophila decipiens]